MKKNKFHSIYFIVIVLVFFVAITIPALYQVSLAWSFSLFLFSCWMGLKLSDAFKIIFLTFVFSYSIFLLFLFFPGNEYKTGGEIIFLGFKFYKNAFQHAVFNWFRLWSISLFSLSSAKVLDGEELVIYLMQKKIISKQLGYSLLMGLNSIMGFKNEWKLLSLNLKLRGIKTKNPFKRVFPLLVYSFRSSLRGAMALRARGLQESKIFYFVTNPTTLDLVIFIGVFSLLVVELVLFISLK